MPAIPDRPTFDAELKKPEATIFIVVGDPAADAQLQRVFAYADGSATANQVAYLADTPGYFSAQEKADWSLKTGGWTVLGGGPPKICPLSGACKDLFRPSGQLDTLAIDEIFAAGDAL